MTLFDLSRPPSCSFGTPWLDHWQPPIGTGKGCDKCDAYDGEPTKRVQNPTRDGAARLRRV